MHARRVQRRLPLVPAGAAPAWPRAAGRRRRGLASPPTPFSLPGGAPSQVGGALLAVNYPQRLHKAFLLNAPTWGGVIWKVLAAVIPPRTRAQLVLFTKKQRAEAAEALLQWVPAEQLPEAYGGRCSVPLQESELEVEMRSYVRRLNQGAERQAAQAAALGVDGAGAGAAEAAAAGERTP